MSIPRSPINRSDNEVEIPDPLDRETIINTETPHQNGLAADTGHGSTHRPNTIASGATAAGSDSGGLQELAQELAFLRAEREDIARMKRHLEAQQAAYNAIDPPSRANESRYGHGRDRHYSSAEEEGSEWGGTGWTQLLGNLDLGTQIPNEYADSADLREIECWGTARVFEWGSGVGCGMQWRHPDLKLKGSGGKDLSQVVVDWVSMNALELSMATRDAWRNVLGIFESRGISTPLRLLIMVDRFPSYCDIVRSKVLDAAVDYRQFQTMIENDNTVGYENCPPLFSWRRWVGMRGQDVSDSGKIQQAQTDVKRFTDWCTEVWVILADSLEMWYDRSEDKKERDSLAQSLAAWQGLRNRKPFTSLEEALGGEVDRYRRVRSCAQMVSADISLLISGEERRKWVITLCARAENSLFAYYHQLREIDSYDELVETLRNYIKVEREKAHIVKNTKGNKVVSIDMSDTNAQKNQSSQKPNQVSKDTTQGKDKTKGKTQYSQEDKKSYPIGKNQADKQSPSGGYRGSWGATGNNTWKSNAYQNNNLPKMYASKELWDKLSKGEQTEVLDIRKQAIATGGVETFRQKIAELEARYLQENAQDGKDKDTKNGNTGEGDAPYRNTRSKWKERESTARRACDSTDSTGREDNANENRHGRDLIVTVNTSAGPSEWLLDTGAQRSMISKEWAIEHEVSIWQTNEPIIMRGIGGAKTISSEQCCIAIENCYSVIGVWSHKTLCIGSNVAGILGTDLLEAKRTGGKNGNGSIYTISLCGRQVASSSAVNTDTFATRGAQDVTCENENEGHECGAETEIDHLSVSDSNDGSYASELTVVRRAADAIEGSGKENPLEYQRKAVANAIPDLDIPIADLDPKNKLSMVEPMRARSYPVPWKWRSMMSAMTQDLIDQKAIERVPSEDWARQWILPCFVKPKPCGTRLRLLYDARALNQQLEMPAGANMPGVLDVLRETLSADRRVIQTYDIKHGFHNVCLSAQSKLLVGFQLGSEVWRWRTLPQGVRSSPDLFTRRMNSMVAAVKPQLGNRVSVGCYMDDLCVAGETMEDCHYGCLVVEEAMRKLELNYTHGPGPCVGPIIFAGVTITDGSYTLGTEKSMQAVRDIRYPQNTTETKQILGLLNYLCVGNAGLIAPNLTQMTRSSDEWILSEAAKAEVDLIKARMQAPTMGVPPVITNVQHTLVLIGDASNTGVGGVVLWVDSKWVCDPGHEWTKDEMRLLVRNSTWLEVISRTHDSTRAAWCTWDMEGYIIYLLCRKALLWSNCIDLRENSILVLSDSRIAVYKWSSLLDGNSVSPDPGEVASPRGRRWLRWALRVEDLVGQIRFGYIAGSYNLVADILSRMLSEDVSTDCRRGAVGAIIEESLPTTQDCIETDIHLKVIQSLRDWVDSIPETDITHEENEDRCETEHGFCYITDIVKAHRKVRNTTEHIDIEASMEKAMEYTSICEAGIFLVNDKIYIPRELYDVCKDSENDTAGSEVVTMRARILHESHVNHCGMSATASMASHSFWWPGMIKHVRRWVEGCSICQQARPSLRKGIPGKELKKTALCGLSSIMIDHFHSHVGDQIWLVVIDIATRYANAFKVEGTSDAMTIEALAGWISSTGVVPSKVYSDNAFGMAVEQWMNQWGCKWYRGSPLYSQSQGLVERLNRELRKAERVAVRSSTNVTLGLLAEVRMWNARPRIAGYLSAYNMVFGTCYEPPVSMKLLPEWMRASFYGAADPVGLLEAGTVGMELGKQAEMNLKQLQDQPEGIYKIADKVVRVYKPRGLSTAHTAVGPFVIEKIHDHNRTLYYVRGEGESKRGLWLPQRVLLPWTEPSEEQKILQRQEAVIYGNTRRKPEHNSCIVKWIHRDGEADTYHMCEMTSAYGEKPIRVKPKEMRMNSHNEECWETPSDAQEWTVTHSEIIEYLVLSYGRLNPEDQRRLSLIWDMSTPIPDEM
jgi:hypothetical protein